MQQGQAAASQYLWCQSAITAGLLALLAVEAARQRGMFCHEGGYGAMVLLLGLAALALAVRTVWQIVAGGSTTPLARTSSAAFLTALFMAALAVSARVAGVFGRGKRGSKAPRNPLRSRITWVIALVLLALALPATLLGSRKLLQARSRPAVPHRVLAELAEILARPWETATRTGHLRDAATKLEVFTHVMETGADDASGKAGRRLVISFQGTRTTEQALANLVADSVRLDGCCEVHTGYARLFERLRPQLYPAVAQALSEVASDESASLYVAGHSLGAAMAQLFIFDLQRHGQPRSTPASSSSSSLLGRTTLVMLGGPTIGDGAFLGRVTEPLRDYANVTMLFDPIPAADVALGPPLGRQVLVIPARPNQLFMGTHTADVYAEALRGPSGAALAATSAFAVGLGTLLVGGAALLFRLRLSRLPTLLLLLGMLTVVWQLALRLGDSAVASYTTLAVGAAAFSAGVLAADPRKRFFAL